MRHAFAAMLVLTLASPAQAGSTQCRGSFIGSIGLALAEPDGSVVPVPDAVAATFLGTAECACMPKDLRVHIALETELPAGTVGTVELWAGPSCGQYTLRTEEDSPCRRVGVVPIEDFTTAGPGSVDLPIDSGSLCRAASALTLIAFTDPQQPFAECDLTLVPSLQLVSLRPPPTVGAARGADGTVVVSWMPATQPNPRPATGYQLLCAYGNGARVVDPPVADTAYSVCLPNKVLERRTLGLPGDGVLGGGNLAALDHGFVCSPPLDATTLQYRLTGLPADRDLQIVVAAVDEYGDASPASAAIVPMMPAAHHGCSFGGGAASSPAAPLGLLVASLVIAFVVVARARRGIG